MVLKMPERGLAKVRSGTHKPLLLTSATVPDGDGRRLHNKQLVAGRLPARRIECGAEDLDYKLVGMSRDGEHIIKVVLRTGHERQSRSCSGGGAVEGLDYMARVRVCAVVTVGIGDRRRRCTRARDCGQRRLWSWRARC